VKKILKSCVFCLGGVKSFVSFRIFLLDILVFIHNHAGFCNILDFQVFREILISFSFFFFRA